MSRLSLFIVRLVGQMSNLFRYWEKGHKCFEIISCQYYLMLFSAVMLWLLVQNCLLDMSANLVNMIQTELLEPELSNLEKCLRSGHRVSIIVNVNKRKEFFVFEILTWHVCKCICCDKRTIAIHKIQTAVLS